MDLQRGRSRLPYLLKRARMTQAELAEYLGVSQPFISQVANLKEVFSYDMAANAADILKCDMMELYEWTRSSKV